MSIQNELSVITINEVVERGIMEISGDIIYEIRNALIHIPQLVLPDKRLRQSRRASLLKGHSWRNKIS